MTKTKLISTALFLTVLLSGFYAGIGFFGIMGGNPTIKLMSSSTFAEFWQHTDHFMAARMKIFGPLLLFTQLITVVLLIKEYRTSSFWFMLTAFCILVADVVFTVTTNMPLNRLIQSWDLNNLPANVQDVKWQVAKAFDIRDFFMMGSFLMVLLAVWFRKAK
jgi:Domain of unknown function (DUF1772)